MAAMSHPRDGLSGMSKGFVHVDSLTVDCADPPKLAAFWQQVIGGTTEVDGDGDLWLQREGLSLIFLAVPEQKTVKNRLHLDLRGDTYEEAIARALELGATRADDVYDGDRWQVLRDPEGNEFCILRARAGS
jgi:Glyoxalase-like domain